MRKFVISTISVLIGFGMAHLLAQTEKKKPAAKKLVQSKAAPAVNADSATIFLFPEFYSYWPVDKNDTLLKYECFDQNETLTDADTLYNMNNIRSIVLMKTYTDYTRTFVDKQGKPQPMPVTSPVYRYDRNGIDKWTGKNVATHEESFFKEHRDQMVRADTTTDPDPITGNARTTIRKYYKVEQVNPE